MKKNITFSFLLIGLLINAQKREIGEADKLYKKFAYVDAIQTYQNLAENGFESVDLLQKLGNSFYFNSDFVQAGKYYQRLYALNQNLDAEYDYRYAQSLKSVGEYKKADEMMERFATKKLSDQRVKLFNSNKDYLQEIENNSGGYSITRLDINSDKSDYGGIRIGSNFIFTSSRESSFSKKIDKRTNQPYSRLYCSIIDDKGLLGTPGRFTGDIESRYHIASPTFTKNGKTMYFSRSAYRVKKNSKEKVLSLKIYRSVYEKDKWTRATELPCSSNEYSTGHPALSPNGRTMYFVSDMPGGYGQSDLYKVSIHEDGTFGIPENLGAGINTEGKESFPFMGSDNVLYFSSDGYPGLGGLDVFMTKLKDNVFEKPINMGRPVNSPLDDFSFSMDAESGEGYVSSNRTGGRGYDDIYSLRRKKKLVKELFFQGIIKDVISGIGIENTVVQLLDEEFNVITECRTGVEGIYNFKTEPKKYFYLRLIHPDFITKEILVTAEGKEVMDGSADLERKIQKVPIGGNLLSAFGLNDVYFDLDKSEIRRDAVLDIEKIIYVMNQNPSILVTIQAYTDSRADYNYNQKLSERRAVAILNYMVLRGISRDRLKTRGFGKTGLKNKCLEGVPCTDQQHEQNRRCEFILSGIK